ncbi:hypothetical protein J6590_019207 [Homalodisca vitripennis]|nr:hypothetical protein J6590_019207 [Homalodisca vitripennis]
MPTDIQLMYETEQPDGETRRDCVRIAISMFSPRPKVQRCDASRRVDYYSTSPLDKGGDARAPGVWLLRNAPFHPLPHRGNVTVAGWRDSARSPRL